MVFFMFLISFLLGFCLNSFSLRSHYSKRQLRQRLPEEWQNLFSISG